MKFLLDLRTSKSRCALFGVVFEWKQPSFDYLGGEKRTTVATIPPQRSKEGMVLKLWGYNKVSKSNMGYEDERT